PQADEAALAAGDEVLSIAGEGEGLNAAAGVAQAQDAFAAADLPDPDGAASAPGGRKIGVLVDDDGMHRILVAGKGCADVAGRGFPELDVAIGGGAEGVKAVLGKGNGLNRG